MGKSTRSKWKKLNRRERAKDEVGNVLARVEKLNTKLGLCAKGGISKVPIQDPETRFHFTNPGKRKPGEKLELSGLTTNPYGKSNPAAPHPVTVNFETVAPEAPIAGCAFTVEDAKRIQKVSARTLQQAVNLAVAEADWTNDEPVEITIGCNDDEHLTTALIANVPKVKKVSGSAAPSKPLANKKETAEAPKTAKLKSMEVQKGITKGDKKIKHDEPTKRIVSGGKKGGK